LICSRRDCTEWRSLRGKCFFSRVYDDGAKIVGRLFVLFLYPGDDQARAVVASRRVGGAVIRNRAKRLLREAIRNQVESRPGYAAVLRRRFFPDAGSGEGLWLVAVARSSIASAHCPDVVAELAEMLDRRRVDTRRRIVDDPDRRGD
jgi:ribonuclease P protein component